MAALVLLLLLSVALVSTSLSAEQEILPDEAEWVTSGIRTLDLYRDLASPDEWESAYLGLGDWGNMNPPIGKLIVGIGIAFVQEDGDRVTFITTWPFDPAKNAANFPPSHYLAAARATIALFGCACLALVYLCAVQLLQRRWIPLVAPVVLFSTWTFQAASTHVFTDVPQLAFLLGAIVAFQSFITSRRWWSFAVALICIGLSCAVKFSTAPVVVAALMYFVGERGDIVQRLKRALVIAVVPLAVFVAVNPFLYPAPVQRSLELVERWSATKRAQQSMPSIAHDAVRTPSQRVARVAARGIVAPRLASWVPFPVTGGIAIGMVLFAMMGIAARSPVTRRRALTLVAAGTAAVIVASVLDGFSVVLPVLTAAGTAHFARRARERDAPVIHFLIVTAVFVVFTTIWLPFDWSRYYLPVIILMSVVYAAGVAQLVGVWSER